MTHLMARGGPPRAIKWVIINAPWYNPNSSGSEIVRPNWREWLVSQPTEPAMSYAIDFLIAVFCAIVATLQIMQIKTTIRYSRYVGPDDQPVPIGTVTDADLSDPECDLGIEIYATKSASCPPPEGGGWKREDDQPPNARSYLNAAFGLMLATAATGLVFGETLPRIPIAWMLSAGVAVVFIVDLPRLIKLLAMGRFSLLVLIPQAFMALGLFAAYRLL